MHRFTSTIEETTHLHLFLDYIFFKHINANTIVIYEQH